MTVARAGRSAEHVIRNRAAWDGFASEFVAAGRLAWASAEPRWGIFGIPESDARILPADLAGLDAVELGCGTAYVSSWLARRGARPIGVDISSQQLFTARAFQREFGVSFPLLQADAERVPMRSECFDFAVSEYGASIWCDPYRWVPEASRLLRPGGSLVFLVNGTFLMLCVPDSMTPGPASAYLRQDYFGMHRFDWPDGRSVDFHLGYGAWIRLLRGNGFQIEDMVELRPSKDATTRFTFVTSEWARRWPAEEVWMARKSA
jgi:SAM-dependent methyltransferase